MRNNLSFMKRKGIVSLKRILIVCLPLIIICSGIIVYFVFFSNNEVAFDQILYNFEVGIKDEQVFDNGIVKLTIFPDYYSHYIPNPEGILISSISHVSVGTLNNSIIDIQDISNVTIISGTGINLTLHDSVILIFNTTIPLQVGMDVYVGVFAYLKNDTYTSSVGKLTTVLKSV